jgi:hypothetical protein
MIQFPLAEGQVVMGICANVTEEVTVTLVRADTSELLGTMTLTPGLDYYPLAKPRTFNTNMDVVPVYVNIPELSQEEDGNCIYFMPKWIL